MNFLRNFRNYKTLTHFTNFVWVFFYSREDAKSSNPKQENPRKNPVPIVLLSREIEADTKEGEAIQEGEEVIKEALEGEEELG